MQNITLPSTLTTIGDDPFLHTKVEYLFLPKNVQNLFTESSFDRMTSLVHFEVDEQNPYFCSIDGILFSKNKTILVHFPAAKNLSIYTIPTSVTIVGYGGFCRLKYLNYVIVPDTVIEFKGANFYSSDIQCIDVFRYRGQPKLIFGGWSFRESTFQESNITYIYSSMICRTIYMFNYNNYRLYDFIFLFIIFDT